MKKVLLPFFAFALLIAGCCEKQLEIPDLSSGNHRVLVEELTGVRCPNCPDGAADLQALAQTYGEENLIIVSIHAATGYINPYPESQHDFRTQEGSDMANFIGAPIGFPTAAIDRQVVNGENFLISSQWPGIIANELAVDYQLGLFLENELDPATGNLHIKVNIAPEQTLDGDNRLTVLITEDSIVDVQQVNLTRVNNYMHRHVLRDVVTQFDGAPLGTLAGGEVYTREFDLTLPADWNPEHCRVIAFVNRGGTPDKAVLQVAEGHWE